MIHPEQLYFIIVPEQFTMQTQKDIVARHPNHGTMNIDIVSFQRLAYRIFEELAVEQLQVLDDMGKSMVLRKAASACRRQLVLFQGHLGQAGFVSQLKTTLSEFYQYGITPQILREIAPEAGSALLRQKLYDLSALFESFQSYIEGHYITTEEVLDVLCRVLPQSELVKNSVIALDGYAGFMPVQYRLLELFMQYARQVIVTVTADRRMPPDQPLEIQNLFYMSSQMVRRLSRLAKSHHVRQLPDLWMGMSGKARFVQMPELAFLEQNLFRFGREQYENKMAGGIRLCQAANPSEEIAGVVHQIWKLIKDEGMCYRDIAVVTGDLDGYGREISHQFEQNGIPFFLDDKKNILDNPMVELIRAALEVIQHDFSYESVFRFLRTGLVSEDREMLDRMENYVLALGIRGYRRFHEPWERVYRGGANLNMVELNQFRDETLAPLFALRERFREEHITVAGMALAVRELLSDCMIEEKLAQLEQWFLDLGEYRLAKEYGQIGSLVDGLLDRLSDLLGEEEIGRKEFSEILDAGFAEISVGVIPAAVDRVVVGDITRTRLAHMKVLFFVGVNDGIVPARKDGGSLLTDAEREFFGKHQLELAPTAREDSFQQRFFLYRMMTKPSGRLTVSWAIAGSDGKSLRASYLVGELRRMFPELKVESNVKEQEIYSVQEAKRALIAGLQKFRDEKGTEREPSMPGDLEPESYEPDMRGRFLELYRWFVRSDEYRSEILRLVDAAFYVYEEQGIGHAVAQALYGKIISGSVTRLEQFAACAYGHFLKYGLELMERQQYELAAADIGNLFHDSIDRCFRQVREEGRDWRLITDAERESMVKACVTQVTEEYGNTILSSSSRNAYLARRVEAITQRTVWALQQQIRRGDFEPAGFEVSFSAADNLQAMKIALSEEEALHLRGRIDRLDLCEDGKQVYVKIIDYKSGSTSFDLLALYYGLQLQLVVYMDAAMEMMQRKKPEKEIIPAGILYYNIADPLVAKDEKAVDDDGQPDDETIRAQILKQLRMNGLVNSELEVIRHLDRTIEKESDIIPVVLKDESVQEGKSSVANRERFEWLRRYVHEKVKQAGKDILNGEIGARPYKSGMRTACDYCPYHAVCGFDKKTPGYEYRRLKNRKTEEIWEELCQ